MIKEMGRLNLDDYKIMDAQVEKIFKSLDKGKREQAIKEIEEMANTANYFVREEMGKRLAPYQGKGPLDEICAEMLDDFIYGIRATALFYFYYKRQDDPRVIVKTLEKTVESVPWESETICFELWKNYPEIMKEEMPHWAMSPNENKRSMSTHGMENIADKNPQDSLTFIGRLLPIELPLKSDGLKVDESFPVGVKSAAKTVNDGGGFPSRQPNVPLESVDEGRAGEVGRTDICCSETGLTVKEPSLRV